MYYLTRPMQRYPRGSLGDVLNFHPLALKNLMPCLVTAYVRKYLPVIMPYSMNKWLSPCCICIVEIEITGSHTQFYDKFNTRYYITQLFKLVWTNPTHREALKLESLYVRLISVDGGKVLTVRLDTGTSIDTSALPTCL